MRHAQSKLTAIAVRKARKPGLYSDGAGLYLQVTTGTDGEPRKSWVFRFQSPKGRTREMGLGSLGVIDLNKARLRAASARELVADNIDPIEHRKTEKNRIAQEASVTFKEAARRYIDANAGRWKSQKSHEQWPNSLETYAYPVFGDVAVDRIEVGHVLRALEPIWKTKTVTAARVRGRIQKVLDWASSRGLRSGENPARWQGHLENILPAPTQIRKVQHHSALPFAEIPNFFEELQRRQGMSARALEFTILTAARTTETVEASWREIDFDNAIWTVPAGRMKAKREHRVPLSAAAIALLRQLKLDRRPDDWIFPGAKDRSPLSNMAMLSTLRKMRADITAHGFRSTFRDWTAETTDYAREVAEAALAHTLGDKVEAAYRRGDLFEKRRSLMADWATYCTSLTMRF